MLPGQERRNKLVKIGISEHLYSLISTVMASDVNVIEDDGTHVEEISRTELDSHANMPVVGQHAYIISDTGRIADVNNAVVDVVKAAMFTEGCSDGHVLIEQTHAL